MKRHSHPKAERKIKIKIHFEDNVPNITADKAQVRQLLQNLTDNAIKYSNADVKKTPADLTQILKVMNI